jgi:hypothetical protein
MLQIRAAIDIVDSYQSEVGNDDSRRIETNINLDFKGFEAEHAQLAAQYQITTASVLHMTKLYTAGSDINAALIEAGGDPSQLDGAMRAQYYSLLMLNNRVALNEVHHTYSGTGEFDPREITEDGVLSTPAFTSSSLSIKVAVKTTNYRRDDETDEWEATRNALLADMMPEDHVLHFILPAGFKNGFYVAPYSHDPEELEFLIMPNTRFKYVKTETATVQGIRRNFHTYEPEI